MLARALLASGNLRTQHFSFRRPLWVRPAALQSGVGTAPAQQVGAWSRVHGGIWESRPSVPSAHFRNPSLNCGEAQPCPKLT